MYACARTGCTAACIRIAMAALNLVWNRRESVLQEHGAIGGTPRLTLSLSRAQQPRPSVPYPRRSPPMLCFRRKRTCCTRSARISIPSRCASSSSRTCALNATLFHLVCDTSWVFGVVIGPCRSCARLTLRCRGTHSGDQEGHRRDRPVAGSAIVPSTQERSVPVAVAGHVSHLRLDTGALLSRGFRHRAHSIATAPLSCSKYASGC
jgi:hypothetical protein